MTAPKIVTLTTKQLDIINVIDGDNSIALTQDDKKTALRLVAKKLLVRTGEYTFRPSAFGVRVIDNGNYNIIR